jgi:membrane-associated phospholipid phosphatase
VAIIALIVPAVIIAVISLLFIPGPTVAKGTPKSLIWRRKLWEWHTGWLGLGLSLAGAFFITSGLKDLVGKPRPDLLARCDPDLSNVGAHLVGGLGLLLEEAPLVVGVSICKNTDLSVLHDGFASFPSGHSSFSWAGLLYLTLWLCAKFAIAIPFLAPYGYSDRNDRSFRPGGTNATPLRNQAAAPPLYLSLLAFLPVGAALYVSASRYPDNRHAGFDIIAGAAIGAAFAWVGFRWYHLPIRRGAGWSWGPRSRDRAFYVGIGIPSYVGPEGWDGERSRRDNYQDLELGNMVGEREDGSHLQRDASPL